MERENLKGQVGNWVVGETFWNREHEVEQLRAHLEEGRHIMVVAPRRVGKTSLMREVASQLEEQCYSVFIDVEHCASPVDAIVELSKETRHESGLWMQTKEAFRDMFTAVSGNVDSMSMAKLSAKFSDATIGRWQSRGKQLMSALADADRPVVLFIDELPILINRMLQQGTDEITSEGRQQADLFLSWLRSEAHRHQSSLRFVVSGSIGFQPILGRAKLSATINYFETFHLDAWDVVTARECLRALANHRDLRFEQDAENEVTDLLGLCIPHHVQSMFDLLHRQAHKESKDTIDPHDVRQVYHEKMLASRGHAELRHYEERLHMVLDDELFSLACDILTRASISDDGVTLEDAEILWRDLRGEPQDMREELRAIFEILEHDGYLRDNGQRWTFQSNLLQDWWKRRFEAYFVPVSERGK